jgi:hypothetical protein
MMTRTMSLFLFMMLSLFTTALHAETATGTFRYQDGNQLRPIAFSKVEIWRFAPRTFGIWG